MNNDRLQGKWQQLKGNVKEQWGDLTDDDITKLDGKTDSLVGTIQERYGHAKEKVAKDVNDWLDKMENHHSQNR